MKRLTQFWNIVLLVCLIGGTLSGTALAASNNLPFKDVDKNDWYYDAVQYVYDNQMMSGADSTSFAPDRMTTRGMLVTILHRLEGTPSASGTSFRDVANSQWYADAVMWASENDIVSGYAQGLFKPNAAITREQLVAILYRYSHYKGYDCSISGNISGFKDVAQVSSYAIDSMKWAIGNKLISGVGDNALSPNGNATRAQVAAILMRYHNNIVVGNDPLPENPAPAGPAGVAQYYDQYREIVKQKEAEWGIGEAISAVPDKSKHDLQGVAIIRLLDMNNDGINELILGYSKLNPSQHGTTVLDSRAEVWSYNGTQAVKLFDEKYPVHASDISVWMTIAHIDGEYLMLTGFIGAETDYTYWGIRDGKMAPVHTLQFTFEYLEEPLYEIDGVAVSDNVYKSTYETWIANGTEYHFNGVEYCFNGTKGDAAAIIAETTEARRQLGIGTETVSPSPADSTPAWSDAYHTFIMDGGYLKSGQTYYTGANDEPIRFGLHDLDNDGIPELIVSNGFGSLATAKSYVYSYSSNRIKYMGDAGFRAGDLVYAPNSGYSGLYCYSGNMGAYYGIYYYIKDGQYHQETVLTNSEAANLQPEVQNTSDYQLYNLFSRISNPTQAGLKELQRSTVAEIRAKGWDAFINDWE